jgi:cysteine-rich repeat protein
MPLVRHVILGLAASSMLLSTACTSDDSDAESTPITQALADALDGQANVGPQKLALDYKLFQPAWVLSENPVTPTTCNNINASLWSVCEVVASLGLDSQCYAQATFFYANEIPRCAGRIELVDDPQSALLAEVYAFDISGEPLDDPSGECGDGELDEGEECDDGNTDMFDGCDPNCFLEPFNGCEAVIESYYASAGIATIDQNDWAGPRSHLMVHPKAIAADTVTETTCAQAIAVAADVCNELNVQMPFVGYCDPTGEFHYEDGSPACTVRLNVWFDAIDAFAGVYTTNLGGVLSFTIR